MRIIAVSIAICENCRRETDAKANRRRASIFRIAANPDQTYDLPVLKLFPEEREKIADHRRRDCMLDVGLHNEIPNGIVPGIAIEYDHAEQIRWRSRKMFHETRRRAIPNLLEVTKQMDIIKLILLIIGVLAVLLIGYWLIGVIFGLFWLLVYAGVIGLVGYGGYKLFFDRSKGAHELEDRMPFGISEYDQNDRALEEYRRKYLPK